MNSNITFLIKLAAALTTSIVLAGCLPSESADNSGDLCKQTVSGVNWEALLTEDCDNFSDYNLFADFTDPTTNPNTGGIPYDMATPLFTDYATKYRFAYVPEGETVDYSEYEVLDFPVGSVLVKTFALPANTSFRGENETIIETRILIHRQNGWVARPYYWETSADAVLAIAGKVVSNVTINHNGTDITFDYGVPNAAQCTSCHSVLPTEGAGLAIFKPIGPKARFLNSDYDYNGAIANQLTHWQDIGVLTNLPADPATIPQAKVFTDLTNIGALSAQDLEDTARGYLDINCAHCHRSGLTLPYAEEYQGAAGGSGLLLEFNRVYDDSPLAFGVCKSAVASGDPDYPYDVKPGSSAASYLLFRMNTNDGRHRMPELGRSTIHAEGVELIGAWIDGLPLASCS